jgi:hypothetical protein
VGTATVAEMDASQDLTLDAKGVIDIGKIATPQVALTTPVSIEVDHLVGARTIALAANTVTVDASDTATGKLQMDVTGYQGGAASNVTLRLDAPQGVTFTNLAANDATITTTALDNEIQSGRIGNLMRYITPAGTYQDSGYVPGFVGGQLAQFYQPALQPFFLSQANQVFVSSAFVLQFAGTAQINTTTYDVRHLDNDVLGLNASVLRDALLLSTLLDPYTPFNPARYQPGRLDITALSAQDAVDSTSDPEGLCAGANAGPGVLLCLQGATPAKKRAEVSPPRQDPERRTP